jgi:hypothetical protein
VVKCFDGRGFCTLLSNDGKQLEVKESELAVAGASLGATPVILAMLARCPSDVVVALVDALGYRSPAALQKDGLDRSAIRVATEVCDPAINPSNRIVR